MNIVNFQFTQQLVSHLSFKKKKMFSLHQGFHYMVHLCLAISIIIAGFCFVRYQADTNNEIDEEFPQLLRVTERSKNIHLVSELVRNGHRLQVEEYLDLSSWNQLIQFKWHDEHIQAENGNMRSLTPNRITALIINQDKLGRKILIQYEPFKCDQRILYPEGVPNESGKSTDDPNWRSLMEFSLSQRADDMSVSSKQRHLKTIETILSTSSNSPYFTKINLEDTKIQAWVFGISAAWLKAQFPFKGSRLNLKTRKSNGRDVKVSDIWQLDSDRANLNITYYLNGLSLNNSIKRDLRSNADYELVQMIEIQEFHLANDITIFDYINIVVVNLDFNRKSVANLFEFPLGFNCASNPMLQEQVNYFENLFDTNGFAAASKMLQLELIATKFKGIQDSRFYSSADIKTVSFATSQHPINPSKSLVMFHIHEDKYKSIRDYNTRISYTIHFKSIYCYINKLHQSSESRPNHTSDPIEVYFSNGITFTMSVQILAYLFNSTRDDENEMRFLNQISIAANKDELTFESRVPQSLEYLLNIIDSAGRSMEKSINIVRVYEQSYVDSKEMYKIRRKGPLKLSRILLLVFNQQRTQRLAKLQINVIKIQTPMSLTRRAHHFDISSCFKSEEKSMELAVVYPMSENLINYFGSRGHELIEEFYSLPFSWLTAKLKTNAQEYNEEQALQKKRFDLSLNFLRVSKVVVKFTPNGELELKMKIIDRPSSINLFDDLESSTFLGDPEEEVLLVESAEQCAQFCDYLNCKMFTFDRLIFECKLSFRTLDLSKKKGENDSSSEIETRDSIKIVHKSSSKLYVKPEKDIHELEEVSLAEIVSYVEHHESENVEKLLDSDYEMSYETPETRIKREISIDKSPIMAFRYTDRSGGDYSPPVRRLLVPIDIHMSNIPISLDVGQEFQKVKVANAFKTTIQSKRYQTKSLLPSMNSKTPPDEQTYVDRLNSAYYTIKRLNFIHIDNCALLCYNIEDSNINSGGQQTCNAFSYCSFEKQCDLLIKTNFGYLQSAISIIDINNEEALNINSLDELIKDGSDCNIKVRNYLSGYQGPISLPENVFGYASTENFEFGLEYEWLRVFKSESSKKEEPNPEKCAMECLKLSKLGKMCLGFDYCLSNNPKPAGSNKEMFGESCHLFLVLNYDKTDRSKIVKEISKTRYQLTRLKSKKDRSITNSTVHNCQRFLTSHLSEYNHIKHRKMSLQLKDKLESPGDSMEQINLDTCALECSIRGSGCQAFEYCLNFDIKNNNVIRKCSLFGGIRRDLKFDELAMPNSSLTEPSKECQIYLRNQIESLYELLKLDSSEENDGNSGDDMSFIAEHIGLITIFSVLYITATILIIVYVKSKKVREFAFRERFSNLLLYLREKFSTN